MRLADSSIVAFVATARPEKARAFYEHALGLALVRDEPFALVFAAKNVKLRIAKVETVSPAPYTALGWEVDDIAVAVQALAGRGVVFERYAGMEQDSLGVWSSPGGARVAWFKDPDGNVLSLTEP